MKTRTANIPIAQIRRDGGTQIRAALDESTVADYAALIKEASQYNLPSVTVYFDGTDHWLSDGFHRIEAALRAGAVRTPCEVRNGTQRDAILAACGANAEHGLRRSHADKRNAVATLLDDPEWAKWSDRKIAKQAVVDHGLVAKMREERRAATSEKLRPVAAGGVALTPLSKGKGETLVQLQPAGEESPAAVHVSKDAPAIEGDEGAGAQPMRGGRDSVSAVVSAPAPDEPIPYAVVVTRDRLVNVERMLRDAQAEIAPLLAKGEALAVQAALSDALAVVRRALQPAPVVTPAPATQPVRARKNGLRIEDENGHELVVEREEDGDTEVSW